MIVPNKNATDPFWENEARTLLTAAIAHVCYSEPSDKRPMAKVLDILHGGKAWEDMLVGLRTAVDVRTMVQNATSLMGMNEKTLSSVMQTARASLGAWSNPKVERVTQKSDWMPIDLRSGRNTTIYLCIDNNQLEANLSIVRVFFGQHIRTLTAGRPPAHGSAPILFMLDEMPRLGRMPPIEEAIELGGGFGLKLWLFAQNTSQLEESYKENAKGILGNCGVRLYMSPDHEAAEMLSEQIGYASGPLQTGRERLIEAAALTGPKFADSQIVTAKATKPARLKKSFAYEDPELKKRIEMGA
jgi:type IV secretion system protein VirD4